MKMILTILIFVFSQVVLHAPEYITLDIIKNEPITFIPKPDRMLWAFMKVESNFDTKVINYKNAGGILQIRPEMIAEANRICRLTHDNKRFVLNDRLDSLKSVQIWYLIQFYRNPGYSLKQACKIWNPGASIKYYNDILKYATDPHYIEKLVLMN